MFNNIQNYHHLQIQSDHIFFNELFEMIIELKILKLILNCLQLIAIFKLLLSLKDLLQRDITTFIFLTHSFYTIHQN